MGLQISEIIPRKEINFTDLKGKTLAIDASNAIYQFLSTIRQPDGTPLQDSKGKITSHLSGLFYRNINLMLEGMKIIYVFDGKPPELKYNTQAERRQIKDIAKEKYELAKESGNEAEMRKYAQQITHLTPEIAAESKELLEAMGVAIIQAPSEGEAQASELSKRSDIYAVVSQDYDCMLFGAPILVRNLTLSRRKKTAGGFVSVYPEIIELEKVLNQLQISHDQLICLGILIGTDYNRGGIKGIGPKRALDIVKRLQYPKLIFDSMQEQISQQENPFNWEEIFELFKKANVDHNVKIEFPEINPEKIKKILMEHDFSEERIESQLQKLKEVQEGKKQKGISDYF